MKAVLRWIAGIVAAFGRPTEGISRPGGFRIGDGEAEPDSHYLLNLVAWRQYGSAFDIADDGPPTLIDVNMLDADKLLPAMTQPAKNLYLHRERLH